MENSEASAVSGLLSEFGARLNEIEEKHRLIKDRIMLVGENLIALKENNDKQLSDIKARLNVLESDSSSIKKLNKRIVEELGNYARNSDLEILQRQMKIFQPLELARIEDVKEIVKRELKNKDIKKTNN